MAFRIIIIDDEPDARAIVRHFLSAYCPDTVVVGEASRVAEAVELIRHVPADLLLLDVQLEDGVSFDILDQLPDLSAQVVFTTAHDDFAIRAFRYQALDYLLKPIDPDELATAVTRARLAAPPTADLRRQIEQLLHTNTHQRFDRIAISTSEGYVFAQTHDLVRLESCGNYTFVFLSNGQRHLASYNLKHFEEMLPTPIFFRLHQSHLVNIHFVNKYLKEDGGAVQMADGAQVPVARRRKDELLQLLRVN